MKPFEEDRIELEETSDQTIRELGEFVRTRRKELGITQELLSELTGLTQSQVSKVERGIKPRVSVQVMIKMVSALGGKVVFKTLY